MLLTLHITSVYSKGEKSLISKLQFTTGNEGIGNLDNKLANLYLTSVN